MPRPRTLPDGVILQATARLIGRHGVAALTLARVAEDVGLAPATLVQRFGSRHGLLVAVGADAAERAAEPFTRASEAGLAPLDAIVTGLSGQVTDIGSAAELAHHLGFLQLDLTDDELHTHARSHHRRTRRAIEDLLVAAAHRGELGTDTDTRRLARDVQVTYQGVLTTWALDEAVDANGRPLHEAVGDELRRVLDIHRIGTDPDHPVQENQ